MKNLEDISPLLPEDILHEYKKEFGEKFENIKKPNITNGLSPVEINKDAEDKGTITLVADLVTTKEIPKTLLPSGESIYSTHGSRTQILPPFSTQPGTPVRRQSSTTPLQFSSTTPFSSTNIVVSKDENYLSNKSQASHHSASNVVINLDPNDLGEPM